MRKSRKKFIISAILLMLLSVLVLQFVYASGGEAGSKEDPIVTLSYVEQRVEQIKFYIDEKIQSSKAGTSDGNKVGGQAIEIVFLDRGQELIADEGTEIILRGGSAVAIDSPSGGLANVTIGRDIQNKQPILANHLHIVPRSDGRGVRALDSNVILMIRGSFRIE